MGQISNILDGRFVPARSMTARAVPRMPQPSQLARLIPGTENSLRVKTWSRRWVRLESADLNALAAGFLAALLFPVVLLCAHVNVPRLSAFTALIVSPIFSAISFKALRVAVSERGACRNVLAVGSGTLALHTLAEIWKSPASRRSVVRVVSGAEFHHLCACGEFATLAREQFLDEVVILSRDVDLMAVMDEARRERLDVTLALPASAESAVGNMAIDYLGRTRLIQFRREHFPILQLAAKRAADVVLSAIALVALSPLLFVISALVAIDSEGPVLYRSQRVGMKGRKFRCYKFRTMSANADAGKEQLRTRNERSGAFFKITDDPRVTRIGKLLRRYSLDELPQLWNVLRGDMSLVGPRPHPPDDLERYGTQHLRRLDFVPGITGLWQVTARQDPSFEKSVALDVEYIRNWSLWLDLQILWRTFGAVLRGSGV